MNRNTNQEATMYERITDILFPLFVLAIIGGMVWLNVAIIRSLGF